VQTVAVSGSYECKVAEDRDNTTTDDVSKLGYTSVIFLDLGVKVDGTYYCDLLLSQQLLPAIRHVSSEFIV